MKVIEEQLQENSGEYQSVNKPVNISVNLDVGFKWLFLYWAVKFGLVVIDNMYTNKLNSSRGHVVSRV